MSKKEEYEKQIEAKLDEWKAEIDILRARADKAEAEMRVKYHEQIDEIQNKEEDAREQLASLKQSGKDSWEDLKKGLEQTANTIKDTFSSIKSNF